MWPIEFAKVRATIAERFGIVGRGVQRLIQATQKLFLSFFTFTIN